MAAGGRREQPPPVLQRLYPPPGCAILPLQAALRRALSACAPRLEPLRRGDPETYRRLLRLTLVCGPAATGPLAQPLPAGTSTQARCSAAELVQRLQWAAGRGARGGAGSVLLLGDGGGGGGGARPAGAPLGTPQAAEWTRVNGAAAALQARCPFADSSRAPSLATRRPSGSCC